MIWCRMPELGNAQTNPDPFDQSSIPLKANALQRTQSDLNVPFPQDLRNFQFDDLDVRLLKSVVKHYCRPSTIL